MSEPLSRIPGGMRYYFGREAQLRRRIEATAMTIFDGWSYEEITTPAVDYYSLFERGMGRFEAQRAFRFTDLDGRLLALRPDVTSAAARAAATLLAERARPLRLCYALPVFRQQPQSHAEWRRESTQMGCELIGANTRLADLEVLLIAVELLRSLRPAGGYAITLNDVGIFNGIAAGLALDAGRREEMRQLIEVRNAADLEDFLTPFTTAEERRDFSQLIQLSGKRETLTAARRVIFNQQSVAALARLEARWEIIESLGLDKDFEIDLGDVSRLDYYTGLTFKIYVNGVGVRVGSGGRYDGLTASFGKDEPAVGFVMDLDALTDMLGGSNSDYERAATSLDRPPAKAGDDPVAFLRAVLDQRAEGARVLLDTSS